jgi:threonine/homoserine efflux transporter RhtA
LIFAFSREFWEQSVIAEVYALNVLFLTLCLFLLLRCYESRENRHLYLFAIVYGPSLGNHNTMVLFGPLAVLFVLDVDREPRRRQ